MAYVLITGAAGFFGSHVCEAVLQRHNFVVGLDNLNEYYSSAIKEKNLLMINKTAEETGTIFKPFCQI